MCRCACKVVQDCSTARRCLSTSSLACTTEPTTRASMTQGLRISDVSSTSFVTWSVLIYVIFCFILTLQYSSFSINTTKYYCFIAFNCIQTSKLATIWFFIVSCMAHYSNTIFLSQITFIDSQRRVCDVVLSDASDIKQAVSFLLRSVFQVREQCFRGCLYCIQQGNTGG